MRTIRFPQNTEHPIVGTTVKTQVTLFNVVYCHNYRLFQQGDTVNVPQQYVPGFAGREDVEFLDRAERTGLAP